MRRLSLTHFTDAELACSESCVVNLNPRFDLALESLRVEFGRAMIVNSCCRSEDYNDAIKDAHPRSLHLWDYSDHMTGGTCAIDIRRQGKTYDEALIRLAWSRDWSIGVSESFLHLDLRVKVLDFPQKMFFYNNIPQQDEGYYRNLIKREK